MKKIIYLFSIISTIFCDAQNEIRSLNDFNFGNFNGVYNKDVDNDFNKVEGTWVSTDNGITFTIKLQKIYAHHYVDYRWNYYEDMLIGEFKIIKDGVEKINTLPNLISTPITEPYKHNIIASSIVGNGSVPINNGALNERGIMLELYDPDIDYIGVQVFMKFFIENGIEKLNCKIQQFGLGVEPYENAPGVKFKFGNYTFIKQP